LETKTQPVYSICITNYNSYPVIQDSLRALIGFTDKRFEIVVVDQKSTDGSLQILQSYADEGLIRLFHQKVRCRGMGRELAFLQSRGSYIISQLDLDDVTGDFREVIRFYHRSFEGHMLVLNDFTIAPKKLIEELGGWRSLNWGEDFDLWSRAAKAGTLVYLNISLRLKEGKLLSRRRTGRVLYDYYVYRDSFRLSRPVRHRWKGKNIFVKLIHMGIASIAFLTYRFHESYRDVFNKNFRLADYSPSDLSIRIENLKRPE
jgi:glycosyltransferase involved in cell wall biosynthesis